MAWSNRRATPAGLDGLAEATQLSEAGQQRALALLGLPSGAEYWRDGLERFLMGLGTALVLAGVVTFFAWNWTQLGHLARFGLLQFLLLAALAAAWWRGPDSLTGRGAVISAAVLVGVLMAVFGQTYQTGADPYGLFLGWALLMLPIALVARQSALWLLWLIVLNLALLLFWVQVLHPPGGMFEEMRILGPLVWLGITITEWRLATWLFVLNGLALIAWEWFGHGRLAWLHGRWPMRITATLAAWLVLAPTLLWALDPHSQAGWISPLLFLAAMASMLLFYRRKRPDLFMLTLALVCLITLIMFLATRYLGGMQGMLLLAILLLAQVSAAAFWLRQVARQLNSEPNHV